MTITSVVTGAPANVSLLKRNAPNTSASPLVLSHSFNFWPLSSDREVVIKMPIPPGASKRTFFAMAKSWRSKFRRVMSAFLLSTGRTPDTKGTLVIATSTEEGAAFTSSIPPEKTSASGCRALSIFAVKLSFSTARILELFSISEGISVSIPPTPALPSKTRPPLNPRCLNTSHIPSTIWGGVK